MADWIEWCGGECPVPACASWLAYHLFMALAAYLGA